VNRKIYPTHLFHKLIDPSQTGAGPDKVIFDNLFSINSILEYMDVNELDGVLISFDQEKASNTRCQCFYN
jgi:hypothetical protein